jgi:hypothetical protein
VPTYERTARFDRDLAPLSTEDRARFRAAVEKFVVDLHLGAFRPGLRVRGVEGAPGVFEMSWAPNGRATSQFGPSRGAGPHVIWRRVGTHDVYREP